MNKILLSPYFLLGILWTMTILATYLDWRDNERSKALLVMTGIMWILVVICTIILATATGL